MTYNQPPTWANTFLVLNLPHAMIYWALITQMGNHLKLTAFLHAAQCLPQLSGTLGQADFHLNQR